MLERSGRICCLGFQKTGTSSLAEALSRLGYRVTNVNREVNAALETEDGDPQAIAERICLAALHTQDVIQDSPAPFVHAALDRAYPGSKFILTYRPFEKWIESYRKYFPDENNALRRWMYGVDRLSGNEARYRAVYDGQIDAIRAHFADRPGDYLEMDLSAGDGWAELVAFLGRDLLPRFPHVNAGTQAPAKAPSRTGLRSLVQKAMR